MGEPVEIKVMKAAGTEFSRGGLECWVSEGKTYLTIRAGTACERILAEANGDGSVVKVLRVWPGDEGCEPLLCAEVVPPYYYIIEVSPDNGVDGVIFRVLKAIDCGGKGVDVVGLVGECVPGDQSHTPR